MSQWGRLLDELQESNSSKLLKRGGGGVRAPSAAQAVVTEHLGHDACCVSLQSRSVIMSIKDQIDLSCDIILMETHRGCSSAVM